MLDDDIPKCHKNDDFTGMSRLMRADRDYIELYARLTGRLDAPAQSQTNVFWRPATRATAAARARRRLLRRRLLRR